MNRQPKTNPAKPTKIYGCSDDLIEAEGGYEGEHGNGPAVLFIDDGTMLDVSFGALGWRIEAMHKGPLFDRIERDENGEDVAWLKPGVKRIFAGGLMT